MATVYDGHPSSTYHASIPTRTNSEHSLDIESSGKSLVNDTEDLQARWEHFVQKHEEDVCTVISTLKFGCSRLALVLTSAQVFQNVGWEDFQKFQVDAVPGLK